MTKPDTSGVSLDADGLPVPDPDFAAKQKASVMAFFEAAASGDDATETDEPVMYAVDPGQWRDLSARIPGLLVTSAGGVCPFQSEGTLHGMPYYFRYRSGYASLDVGGEDHTWEPLYHAGVQHGDDLDGFLDRTQFADLMAQLVPQLKRAPFRYYFEGRKVHVENTDDGLVFTATDEPEEYVGWGATPEDAYESASECRISTWLIERGWTEENQRENHRLRNIQPIMLNEDTRVFPDVDPVFTVRTVEG